MRLVQFINNVTLSNSCNGKFRLTQLQKYEVRPEYVPLMLYTIQRRDYAASISRELF